MKQSLTGEEWEEEITEKVTGKDQGNYEKKLL
jgi:hypothetical protein